MHGNEQNEMVLCSFSQTGSFMSIDVSFLNLFTFLGNKY